MDKYFNKSLELVIYTIGYAQEGESIIVLVKMDGTVAYSIIIDGYELHNDNCSVEILNKEKIKNVDLFCWSHPDRDHSLGLEKYISFLSKRTKIIVGNGYCNTIEKWNKANPIMAKFIYQELQKPLKQKDRIKIRQVITGVNLVEEKFIDARTSIAHVFKVEAFSPSDYQNLRREVFGKSLENNNISVGLTVKLGGLVAVFCADVPNVIFNNFEEEEFPSYIDYIKIPHHCSMNSDALLRKFKNQPEIACTTVNVANGLPNRKLLNEYINKVENVFCTNDLTIDSQKLDWGVCKTTMRIDLKPEYINNDLYGNAREVI